MDSGDKSEVEPMSTYMFEVITDSSQSHMRINRTEARYQIHDLIKLRKLEWKGKLKYTQNMGKGLHKVFKTVVKYISQYLPTLGESGSEVYHFIPEPKNCAKVTRLSCDVKQP